MLRKIRRIVTGHNAQGKSVIASDAPSPHVLSLMTDPPFGLTDPWVTRQSEESDGKTTITTTTLHKTVEGRDGHLASGRMEAGMTDGYVRLDELLAALTAHGPVDKGLRLASSYAREGS
ncbi:MAG TPA: hypothetical protein VGK08_02110 [Thermoanaerobaculia bacterium]|jgi:hypothetical protein